MEFITVTSGLQNAANFTSNFINSIQLSDNYEIALLKIAHAPLANITDKNNKLYFSKKISGDITGEFMDDIVTIPTGYYKSSHDVIHEMFNQLQVRAEDPKFKFRPAIKYDSKLGVSSTEVMSLSFVDKDVFFYANHEQSDNILFFLDFKFDDYKIQKININNYDLKAENQLGFIYTSIVSNSIIDSNSSRLLDTVPLISDDGYSFYESNNPVFHRMGVASFIDIQFQIRSADGQLVKFSPHLPSILTLSIRKKTGESYIRN